MGITEEQVISTAEELLAAGINPSMKAVRDKLGTGSYATISPFLRKWKEGRKTQNISAVEMPSDIKTALDKFGCQLWSVASAIATQQLDHIREEARSAVDAANSERIEAMEEIERLESDISVLNTKMVEQSQRLDDLVQLLNKSELINATMTQRSEHLNDSLKSTQLEIKEIKAAKQSYVDKVEALLNEKSELSRVNGELNQRVISYKKELEVMVLKFDATNKVLENMELINQQSKVDIDELKKQLGEARIGVSELNGAIDSERQQRKIAELCLAELKAELQILRNDLKQLQAQLIEQVRGRALAE